ncbi:Ig-like domain-containing protein [Paenibacillus thiaminolyticus]|uniref:Ig-like domain-containing protein n=1 Tax=Paenibacillus thiaminolyticus TaxID=49283 RepID=UPI0035A71C4E
MNRWLSALLAIVILISGAIGWGPGIVQADTINPTIVSNLLADQVTVSPAPNERNVPLKSEISIKFPERMTMVAGHIVVMKEGGAPQYFNKDGSSGMGKVVSSDELTFKLQNGPALELGVTYQVTIDATFEDNATNQPILIGKNWSFTVKSAPGVEAVFPNKEKDVSVTPTLKVAFKQPVKASSGTIQVFTYNNSTPVRTLKASDFVLETNRLMATYSFTENNKLDAGTAYYVKMVNNPFVDDEDIAVSGYPDEASWFFETKRGIDTSPPQLVKKAPEGSGVSESTRLELTFDKPVYQGSGEILIKASDGTIKDSIPVTALTGGGTNTIQSRSLKNLAKNQNYTVEIPDGAFRNVDGYFITKQSWTFQTVAADTSAPVISSYDPSRSSVGVSTSKELIATFNKPIVYSGNGVELIRQGSSVKETIEVTVKGDRELRIVPKNKLQDNTVYTVNIARGAVKDRSGNEFQGITNVWTFSTGLTDRNPPAIEDIKMYNSTVIQIRYNKELDSNVSPPTNEFTVTVNNQERRVSNAYTLGNYVFVSLESGVSVGQDVRISYAGRFRLVRDTLGNVAAAFSARNVENSVNTSLSNVRESYIYNDRLTISLNESIKSVSTHAYSQFTVTFNGSTVGVDKITNSGSYIYLTLNRYASDGDVIKISYTPGSYPLEDTRGGQIPAFEGVFVRNSHDRQPPQLTETGVTGNRLIMTYNKALDKNSIPLVSHFSVLVNEKARYVTKVEIKENQIFLTLQSGVLKTDIVTVSYVRGNPPLRDLNGNNAVNLNLISVGNTTDSETPAVQSANWTSPSIVLTFNKTLESMQFSSNGQFYVRAGSQLLSVRQVTVSGTKVTIELLNPPAKTDELTVTYNTGGAKPIRSTSGVEIKAISNMNVTVSLEDLAGANFVKLAKDTSFIDSMFVLVDDAAQKSSDRATSGQVVNRYTLDASKLKTAFQFVATSGGADKQLMYEVPSGETAARVSIPLSAFDSAYITTEPVLFAIKYGNTLYGITISRDSIIQIVQSLKGSISNSSLLIEIEPAQAQQTNIVSALSRLQATALVQAHQFTLYGYSGSQVSGLTELQMEAVIKIRTTDSVPANRTAIVEYQTSNSQLAYLPTKLYRSGTVTVGVTKVKKSVLAVLTIGNKVYADVPSHWANNDMIAMSAKMIMEGRSSTKFEPNKPITREEFAVAISRALGLEPNAEAARRFPDVSNSTINGAYIGAAIKAGIISGFPDGTFKPNDSITREQLTQMMVRASEAAGHVLPRATTTVLGVFKDSNQITKLGAPTVAQAVQAGLIQGVKRDKFDSKGSATRAQAAVLLRRLLLSIDHISISF